MTLDQRIRQDLSYLFKNHTIPTAQYLSLDLFGICDQFSAYGLPQHFTGDREADTVMVMLNPGKDVAQANKPMTSYELIKKLQLNTDSPEKFISSYMNGCKNYGELDKTSADNFDLKQAFFLYNWKGWKNKFRDGFDKINNGKSDIALEAKETVLMKKLQLELVPYASRTFNNIKKLKPLFPYLETIFDEIFKYKREYVIFCSDFFDKLFKEFLNTHPERIIYDINTPKSTKTVFGTRLAYCSPIRIYEKDKQGGNSQKAIIAHTFPNQALPNAYGKMIKYGGFCYEEFNKSQI